MMKKMMYFPLLTLFLCTAAPAFGMETLEDEGKNVKKSSFLFQHSKDYILKGDRLVEMLREEDPVNGRHMVSIGSRRSSTGEIPLLVDVTGYTEDTSTAINLSGVYRAKWYPHMEGTWIFYPKGGGRQLEEGEIRPEGTMYLDYNQLPADAPYRLPSHWEVDGTDFKLRLTPQYTPEI